MFNFKKLLIVFKTNWKNVINETLPKGNSSILNKSNIDDVFTGIIFISISSFLCCILNTDIISLIVSIIRLIICAFLIYIINKYNNKKVSSTIVFILFVVASLNMLASSIASIIYLFSLLIKLKNALALFTLSLFETIGFAFLVATFISFLRQSRKEYDDEHYVLNNEKIKLKTIDINDVSMHVVMSCDICGSRVIDSDIFCPNCGKKLK